MGLDCNIIPQIKVGDSYTDSKCFQDLWDRAKKLYPNDPVKARAVAKADYDALKSASFTSEYGDWVLLRAVQNAGHPTKGSIHIPFLSHSKFSLIKGTIFVLIP